MSRVASPLSALDGFGLTPPEIAVYLALLELGPQPASIIARKAKLKRGHTYNVLSLLQQKGIAQEFEKKKIKHFTAIPPRGLLTILERRKEGLEQESQRLTEVLPLLEKLRNPLIKQARVRFFQGAEGVKEIYEDTMRVRNQPIHAFVDFTHCFPGEHNRELNDWMWRYTDRRAKRGVWYLGIAVKSAVSDLAFRRRRRQKRKLKMLKSVDLPVEINIYGDKVAVVSSSRDMVGFIIEDRPTADALRGIHRAMWGVLPDYIS
jgi:sugar-specific transcriptional regulator TrmB